jgi:hypothetical protein
MQHTKSISTDLFYFLFDSNYLSQEAWTEESATALQIRQTKELPVVFK